MSDQTPAHSKEEIERVIAKVQKILARAGDGRGATEAEADTALKIAQDLMAKYNLDMAAISDASSPDADSAASRVKEMLDGYAKFHWQRRLAKYVAEANFCYHMLLRTSEYKHGRYEDEDTEDERYISGRRVVKHQHIFVGRKANVISTQLMFQYLIDTIESQQPFEQRFSRSANSWKEGCADRLCERLADRRKDLMEEHDAKVRAAEAEFKARAAKAQAAKDALRKRELPPNEGAEVRAAMETLAETAIDASDSPRPEAPAPDPVVAEGDNWTPPDSTIEPEPAQTAMVLASVYDQSEQDANEDLMHDREPGTTARWRREREERRRAREEEEAKEEAEAELNRVDAPVREETERQKAARLRREAREHEKDLRRWAREDEREHRKRMKEWEKTDHTAYRAGAAKGREIGLDGQVGARDDTKRIGGKS